MKNFYGLICLLFISMLAVSCSKDQGDANVDEFIGTYSVTVSEQATWMNNSTSSNDSGMMTISKITSNSVQVSGYISTTGSVSGSMLFLNPSTSSDSSGYLTTTYSPCILTGNVLTFTANQNGQLAYYGTLYPFSSIGTFTAIKLY